MRQWQGCRMINPLCPDDLCCLPMDHPEHQHQPSTWGEPMPAEVGRGYPMLETPPWSLVDDPGGRYVMIAYDESTLIEAGRLEQEIELLTKVRDRL